MKHKSPSDKQIVQATSPAAVLLNADLGEGCAYDRELMPWLDLANVACAAHAGSDALIKQTIELALQHGVQISAHPGYPDRENFGRESMRLSHAEFSAMLLPQLERLRDALARHEQALCYVKPHGALYNDCAVNPELSEQLVQLCRAFDRSLTIIGLAGSRLLERASAAGLRVYAEGFCDRRYLATGQLAPRNLANACINDAGLATQQAMQLIDHGRVTCIDGSILKIPVDTLCVHGDSPVAVTMAKQISRQLQRRRQHASD
ncbi:MAG: 5-oxoprolinase subunit PxpA [Pseudomonadales bacterium]|nr:LamB/YcsF family protein [Gammaproteobacteria bacterium]NNL57735.1 5-oxoprolinase subunit PxpA [Pseudomonadales bacterium]